jgi:hypothetical protein
MPTAIPIIDAMVGATEMTSMPVARSRMSRIQPDDLRGPSLFGVGPFDDLAAVADLDAGSSRRGGGVEQRFELVLGHRPGTDVVDDLGVGDGSVAGLEQRRCGSERVDDLADVVEFGDACEGLGDRGLVGGVVDPTVCGGEHCDSPSSGLGREASLELVERLLRGGAGHLEVVGGGLPEPD